MQSGGKQLASRQGHTELSTGLNYLKKFTSEFPLAPPAEKKIRARLTRLTVFTGYGWWAEWRQWEACVGICEWGIKHRTRECPRDYCTGSKNESAPCDIAKYCVGKKT